MKIVLTGHSRGLGEALARACLLRELPLLAIARHRHAGLADTFGPLLTEVELDLADEAALLGWLAGSQLEDFLSGARSVALLNNAGSLQPMGPASRLAPAEIARALSLNVAAPLMLGSALLAAARSATDLRILHVSSGAARSAYPGWNIYCASKAALDQHARALALEQHPGLRIEALAPGVIDTAMQAEIRAASLNVFPPRERFDALWRSGALASPVETAGRIVEHLLSERFGADPVTDLRTLSPSAPHAS